MKTVCQIFALIILTALSSSVLACSCRVGTPFKQHVSQARLIFKGKVLKKTYTHKPDENGNNWHPVDFLFQITSVYKGIIIKDTISIRTGAGGGDCGYDFENNSEYVVYAQYDPIYYAANQKIDWYSTISCSRTSLVSDVKGSELRQLEKMAKLVNKKPAITAMNIVSPPDVISRPTITSNQLENYIGKSVLVTGTIVSGRVMASDGMTLLNVGADHPNQDFTIIIASSDKALFGHPEKEWIGKKFRLAGKPIENQGRAEMHLTGTDQIEVDGKRY